jgi:AmmeMemoRadiSam system protein A
MVAGIAVNAPLPSPAICFAGLLPHAPVLVPAVGGARGEEVAQTVAAMRKVAAECQHARPDALVLISPHSPRRRRAFGLWEGSRLHGSLAQFRAPQAAVELPAAPLLRAAITAEMEHHGLTTWPIPADSLDHGAVVPLWFLAEAGWAGPTVILSLDYPGESGCPEVGAAIATAAAHLDQRVAVIASGDMSHRLQPGAPAGFDPRAHQSDERFLAALRQPKPAALLHLDPGLLELAAEDALDATVVALAAAGWRSEGREVLSYEAPFGVGYGVAVLFAEAWDPETAGCLPAIARRSVESALNGETSAAPGIPAHHPFNERQAGVFVTLHAADGKLRGCVGTIEPQCADVVAETWHNARSAAFHDRRFAPVEAHELARLRFDVSLLEPAEDIASPAELDPHHYGVIVSASGGRRGLLLPAIEGIDTAAQQLEIARRKAGIGTHEPVRLQRFRTTHFTESRPAAAGREPP